MTNCPKVGQNLTWDKLTRHCINKLDFKRKHTEFETYKCKHISMYLLQSPCYCVIFCVWNFVKKEIKSKYHATAIKLRLQIKKYGHVPPVINVWTKYGESRMHDKEKTDLIMKTWHKETMKMRSFPRWFLYLIDVSCTTLGSTFQMGCTQQHRNRVLCRVDPVGGAPGARPPLKLEKIWFFGVKSWFFTRNTPKSFAPPSARHNFF